MHTRSEILPLRHNAEKYHARDRSSHVKRALDKLSVTFLWHGFLLETIPKDRALLYLVWPSTFGLQIKSDLAP